MKSIHSFELNQSSTVWNGAQTGGQLERENCKRNSIFVLNFESMFRKENGVFKCVSTFFAILDQNCFEIFRQFNNQLPVMKVFSTVITVEYFASKMAYMCEKISFSKAYFA